MKTEKKLELLREIRMENEKNRVLMETRQRIVGIPVGSGWDRQRDPQPFRLTGLRFRILGAFLLLGGFIVFQRMGVQYQGIDAVRVVDEITRTVSIEKLIDDGRVVLVHEETGTE